MPRQINIPKPETKNDVLERIERATSVVDLKELLKEAAQGKLKVQELPRSRVDLNDIKPNNR